MTPNTFGTVVNAEGYEGKKLVEEKHLKSVTRSSTPPSDLLQGVQSCAGEGGQQCQAVQRLVGVLRIILFHLELQLQLHCITRSHKAVFNPVVCSNQTAY